MTNLAASLRAHWYVFAFALGLWAALATVLVRRPGLQPGPQTPAWRRALFLLFVDWPAMLPRVDFAGLFGLPFNVPFLSVSRKAPDAKGQVLRALLPFAVLAAGASCGSCQNVPQQVGQVAAQCSAAALKTAQDLVAAADAGGKSWFADLQAALDAGLDTACVAQALQTPSAAAPAVYSTASVHTGELLPCPVQGDADAAADAPARRAVAHRLLLCRRSPTP